FSLFLIARALVGLGEAAYAPAAQSMISGGFPQERRAFAQAIFASGMLLGGACGGALGGIIGAHYGWKYVLFVVAFAGILPGLAVWGIDRKSTRLNSSHGSISYAVFCSPPLRHLHPFPTRRSSDLMISGGFPQERRAFAQAIFASGMLLGGACGGALGGIIGAHYGWKYVLFVVAFAGILPGLAVWGMEEPPRGPRSEVVPIRRLLSVPAFVAMIAAGICITFSTVSLNSWGVDFAKNYKDFSLREASVSLSLITLFSLVL